MWTDKRLCDEDYDIHKSISLEEQLIVTLSKFITNYFYFCSIGLW